MDETQKEPKLDTVSAQRSPDSTDAGEPSTEPAEPIQADLLPRPSVAEDPVYVAETNTILFHQVGNLEDQVAFYIDELAKLGWEEQSTSEVDPGMAWLDFKKGSLAITITVEPREDKITTIAQGSGIDVPDHLVAEDMKDAIIDDGEFETDGDE